MGHCHRHRWANPPGLHVQRDSTATLTARCVSREWLPHTGTAPAADTRPMCPLCTWLSPELCHQGSVTCSRHTPNTNCLTAPPWSPLCTLCAHVHARRAAVSHTCHCAKGCRHLRASAPTHCPACPLPGGTGTGSVPRSCAGHGQRQEKVRCCRRQRCQGRHVIAAAVSPGANKGCGSVRPAWGCGAGRIDACRAAAICCHSIHLHLAGGHQCPARSMLTAAAP